MKRTPLRKRARRRSGFNTSLRDELDRLARRYVMMRADAAVFEERPGRESWFGKCQRCHLPHWLSWCHVFTRACFATRWDPDNAFAWCSGCHRHMDQHWEEKRRYTIERIGQAAFDGLNMRVRAKNKTDLGAVKLHLMALLIRLRDARRA